MWRTRLRRWGDRVTLADPASEEAIRACEVALGQSLPADLADLLRECDGIDDEYGAGLVWSTGRIASDNQMFRSDPEFAQLYMPFDSLLFFADAGDGDQFAFVLRDRPADVFIWDHETDSRTMIAPGLAAYLEWRLASSDD